FLVFDPLGEMPDAGPDVGPGVSVHRDFEEFVVALKHVLAGCQDIPGSLLDQLAARVRNGLEGVMGSESVQHGPVTNSTTSDSAALSKWLPKETRAITEQLAIAMLEEIIHSSYEPGDRINPRLLSRPVRATRA